MLRLKKNVLGILLVLKSNLLTDTSVLPHKFEKTTTEEWKEEREREEREREKEKGRDI